MLKVVTVLLVILVAECQAVGSRNLISLNEETWTDILHGEWMVEL